MTMDEEKTTTTISVRDIDVRSWKWFRTICLMENKTIAQKLNEIIVHACEAATEY